MACLRDEHLRERFNKLTLLSATWHHKPHHRRPLRVGCVQVPNRRRGRVLYFHTKGASYPMGHPEFWHKYTWRKVGRSVGVGASLLKP
jgi:hypothetical protein